MGRPVDVAVREAGSLFCVILTMAESLCFSAIVKGKARKDGQKRTHGEALGKLKFENRDMKCKRG